MGVRRREWELGRGFKTAGAEMEERVQRRTMRMMMIKKAKKQGRKSCGPWPGSRGGPQYCWLLLEWDGMGWYALHGRGGNHPTLSLHPGENPDTSMMGRRRKRREIYLYDATKIKTKHFDIRLRLALIPREKGENLDGAVDGLRQASQVLLTMVDREGP